MNIRQTNLTSTLNLYTTNEDKKRKAVLQITENKILNYELIQFILGDFIGMGVSRAVFTYKPDPKYVIKIEIANFGANWLEYQNWRNYKDVKDVGKWLCPIYDISENGLYMIQTKAKHIQDISKLPKKIPIFLGDIKSDNFGWIGKRLVCLDYAWINLDANTKLRNIKWPY